MTVNCSSLSLTQTNFNSLELRAAMKSLVMYFTVHEFSMINWVSFAVVNSHFSVYHVIYKLQLSSECCGVQKLEYNVQTSMRQGNPSLVGR